MALCEDGEATAAKEEDGEATAAKKEDEEAAEGASWQKLRHRLLACSRSQQEAEELFLELFEREYSISNATEALFRIQHFLGLYLVQDFDYRRFSISLGVPAKRLEEEEWAEFQSNNVAKDLGIAASMMMRLAAMIAKAHGLQMADWKDINAACGNAVRAVPACYRLQRELPGPLNDARALRYLPVPTTDAGRDLNPWRSDEGRLLFEQAHRTDWALMETLTHHDSAPSACFSGVCSVEDFSTIGDLVCVRLRVLRPGEAPSGCPAKDLVQNDELMWEIDTKFSALLLRGLTIEGDWYEMRNEVCFMAALTSVAPAWALDVSGSV